LKFIVVKVYPEAIIYKEKKCSIGSEVRTKAAVIEKWARVAFV